MRQHPVLVSEVIGVDRTPRYRLSVFCDVRLHSVPLEVCQACPSCVAITGSELEGSGCVRCAPPDESVPSTLAPTGRALHRGVIAVDEAVLVRDIVVLFVERGLRLVVITDVDGRAAGVVYESQLLHQIQDHAHSRVGATRLGWEAMDLEPASALMRAAPSIAENIPLRTALAAMATAHQRQLLVLDEQGFPVGVLFDVDALHALYGRDD
jgi:CBS domain-containing protein